LSLTSPVCRIPAFMPSAIPRQRLAGEARQNYFRIVDKPKITSDHTEKTYCRTVKKIILLLLFPIWWSGSIMLAQELTASHISDVRDITRFLGTYPCDNGLLRSPAILSALRKTLGQDYREYRQHIALSGCGSLEMRDKYVFADVSQLHVGGYTSYILISPSDRTTYVFWLKSTVREKDWAFYGPRPIPETVLHIVETKLNEAWGHVANFRIVDQNLMILPNKP
jgi:hypothetical protein